MYNYIKFRGKFKVDIIKYVMISKWNKSFEEISGIKE
jgi:hypothetical protein